MALGSSNESTKRIEEELFKAIKKAEAST